MLYGTITLYTCKLRSADSDVFMRYRNKQLLASSCLSVCPSLCPHETTRLRMEALSLNLILENISKFCRENSSFIKIWQEQRVEHVRNVMAHAQKPYLVFQQNGRFHLNRRGGGGQFSRLLAAEQCGSADRPWIDHVPTYSARLLATHSIRIFPLHFPSRASPCAITFRTPYTLRQDQYTGCFTTLGHRCRRWFPRSLWSKKFI